MYGVLYTSLVDRKTKCLRVGFGTFAQAHAWAEKADPNAEAKATSIDLLTFTGMIVVHRD